MSLVDAAFAKMLRDISPPRTQRLAAASAHRTLRSRLEQDAYFGPMIMDSFLNGSYARRTVIRPIKDVDIIIVVGGDWLDVSPDSAMESLRRKCAQWYPPKATHRQRRAIRIDLATLSLDVLLAVAPNGLARRMRIPDRRAEDWIETHPRKQLRLSRELDEATGGNYRKLVRLAKAWAAVQLPARAWPGSFVIECSVYAVVVNQPEGFCGSLPAAFGSLLMGLDKWDMGRAEAWFLDDPTVPDPALPDMNVAAGLSAVDGDCFRKLVRMSLKKYRTASKARYEDSEFEHWAGIFGSRFPGITSIQRTYQSLHEVE